MQDFKEMPASNLRNAKEVKVTDLEVLQDYMSVEEREALQREKDYMEHGAGKVEAILNEEMGKLFANMEDKMKKQDEEFQLKLNPPKK